MARIKITVDGSQAEKQLSAIKTKANETDAAFSKISKSSGIFSDRMKSLGATLAATYASFVSIRGAFDIGSSIVKLSSQFEQYENRLSSFYKTQNQVNDVMNFASTFADEYNTSLSETTDAMIKMKNYGIDPTEESLKAFMNTAIGSGKSLDQFVEAMADAFTGENERLKEFGVKASVVGTKIGYAWTDASGAARNVIVQNNKEIIESTLTAIFNQKYAGQLERYASSWEGILQGIKTDFEQAGKEIGEAGLFSYIKAAAGEASVLLSGMFDSGKGAAAGFAEAVKGGVEFLIRSFAVLSDTLSGFGAVFGFIKTVFWQMVGAIGTGINTIQSSWVALGNGMSQLWADIANGIKRVFADMINDIIRGVNSISGYVNAASNAVGMDAIFGTISEVSFAETAATIGTIVAPISNVETAWKYAADAQAEYQKNADDLVNGTSQKNGEEVINSINAGYAKESDGAKKIAKERAAADKALDDHIKKYGLTGDAAAAAGKKAAGAMKNTAGAIKESTELYRKFLELTGDKSGLFQLDVDETMQEFIKSGKYSMEQLSDIYDGMWDKYANSGKDANKEIALDFSQQFEGLFEGLISGDLSGAVKGLFSGISQELSKGLISSISKNLTGGISSLFGGLGELGQGLVGLGIGLLGSLLGGDTEQTPPVLDDMAKTSESMANSLEYIKDAQYPMLALTREMTGYLSNIDKAFAGAENSLLNSGLDLGGSSFKGTASAGFFGLTSKSTELFGTSIQVGAATLSDVMAGWVNATLLQTTKTVKKGILKTKTSYSTTSTNISELLGQYLQEATANAFEMLTSAGTALGISTAGLANQSINIGTFDTTGMSAAEVTAELEGRFSAQFDTIANSYFSAVAEFQRGGEGLAETLTRVVVNFDQVRHSMELINKSVDWRTANIIVDIAGGLDALNGALASYTENFFSAQEQYDMQANTMAKAFETLGVAMPNTNEEFRRLVEGIDTTTDAGAALFAEVIGLAGGFNDMTTAAEEAAEVINTMIKDVADAWLGNLSYLTLKQKADYASAYLALTKESNGQLNSVDAARAYAEAGLKSTSTKEEYIPIFDAYIKELENQAPEATLDDVVKELKDLNAIVKSQEETIRRIA
jgi:hypothetical protein